MPGVLPQAGLFAAAGVTKIRLTGGEPTLRPDLVPLTAALRALPGVQAVGITTNALTLQRKLADLQVAGGCRETTVALVGKREPRMATWN